jgi:hypothetical protein
VIESIAGDADLVGGESIKHEGVIGVGTMRDGNIERSVGFGFSGFQIAHGK